MLINGRVNPIFIRRTENCGQLCFKEIAGVLEVLFGIGFGGGDVGKGFVEEGDDAALFLFVSNWNLEIKNRVHIRTRHSRTCACGIDGINNAITHQPVIQIFAYQPSPDLDGKNFCRAMSNKIRQQDLIQIWPETAVKDMAAIEFECAALHVRSIERAQNWPVPDSMCSSPTYGNSA